MIEIYIYLLCAVCVINAILNAMLTSRLYGARRELAIQKVRNQWLKSSLNVLGWSCDEREVGNIIEMNVRRLEGGGE